MLVHYHIHTQTITVACQFWHPAMITYILDYARHCYIKDRDLRMIYLIIPSADVPLVLEQLTAAPHTGYTGNVSTATHKDGDIRFNYEGFSFTVVAATPVPAFAAEARSLTVSRHEFASGLTPATVHVCRICGDPATSPQHADHEREVMKGDPTRMPAYEDPRP